MLALLAQASEPLTDVTSQIQFDAFTVTALVSLVIPVLTGLITRYDASPTLKQLFTIFFAAVNTIVVQSTLADGTAVISKETGLQWAVSTAIALFSYVGIYKAHDLNASLAPEKGLG